MSDFAEALDCAESPDFAEELDLPATNVSATRTHARKPDSYGIARGTEK